MDALKLISDSSLKAEVPEINIGSTVRVHVKIREGERERIQMFEGTVIAKRGSGISSTFTVRRVAYGVGVERVFPYNSPRIQKVEVVRPGKVRRAKLYYLRDKIGKDAKVKTLVGAKVTAAMQARNAAANAAAAAKEAPAEETAQN